MGGAALNAKAVRANVFVMAPEMVGDVWRVRSQTLGLIQTDSRVDLALANLYDEIDQVRYDWPKKNQNQSGLYLCNENIRKKKQKNLE